MTVRARARHHNAMRCEYKCDYKFNVGREHDNVAQRTTDSATSND